MSNLYDIHQEFPFSTWYVEFAEKPLFHDTFGFEMPISSDFRWVNGDRRPSTRILHYLKKVNAVDNISSFKGKSALNFCFHVSGMNPQDFQILGQAIILPLQESNCRFGLEIVSIVPLSKQGSVFLPNAATPSFSWEKINASQTLYTAHHTNFSVIHDVSDTSNEFVCADWTNYRKQAMVLFPKETSSDIAIQQVKATIEKMQKQFLDDAENFNAD